VKPKIGLVALYFDMFDDIMPPTFRREKEAVGEEVAGMLAAFADVEYPGIVANEATAASLAQRWHAQDLDAVVLFPTMASPPLYSWRIVQALAAPILIWNGHLIREIHDSFTYHDANRYSSNIGAVMITNVLLREGRRFHLVSGYYRDPATLGQVRDYLQAAGAARRLRAARIGRIGSEIPGYADVSIDEELLRNKLGPEVIWMDQAELESAYRSVATERIRAHQEEVNREYAVEVPDDILTASIRIALALEDLVGRHRLDAVALNCHSDLFRRNPEIGLVACYGASRLTGAGIPVSCTGDVPTVIAMLILKTLGGQSQYCECVMTDHEKDCILFTNTGEGDPTLASANVKKCLICNDHYPGVRGGGASPVFPCRGGGATMVAFSPKKGVANDHVVVVAPGEVLGTQHESTRVTNALFRFRNYSSIEGFNRWCRAGAPHHGAFTLGDFSERIRHVAELWGVESILV